MNSICYSEASQAGSCKLLCTPYWRVASSGRMEVPHDGQLKSLSLAQAVTHVGQLAKARARARTLTGRRLAA